MEQLMSFFPMGVEDTDIIIMLNLDDWELAQYCRVNKYINNIYNNNHFWHQRVSMDIGIKLTYNIDYKNAYLDIYKAGGLAWAVTNGHFEVFEYLINGEEDRKTLYKAFILSATNGRINILEYLVKRYPNAWDIVFAMEASVAGGHLNMVEYLVNANSWEGYNHNKRRDVVHNLLASAALGGNLDIVKYLVTLAPYSHLSLEDTDNMLEIAARSSNIDVVNYLIGLRMYTPGRDVRKEKALKDAVSNGRLDIVVFLARWRPVKWARTGKNTIIITLTGRTLTIIWALKRNDHELIEYLSDFSLFGVNSVYVKSLNKMYEPSFAH